MKEVTFSENKESKGILESLPKIDDSRNFKELLDLKINKDNFKESNEKEDKVIKLSCRNQELEEKEHPETSVMYERKIVEDGEGNKVEGVFPQFKSEYEATLEKEDFKASDIIQFNRANKQLKDAVNSNLELGKKFTAQQLEMINLGMKPKGYTWHHSEELGKLQLVDSKIHSKTGHTGGQSVWGGGNENR